jgi:CheY-like chemotaxis protein
VREGEFVEIAVRDNGRGMAPEVMERAVEPFFTTKKFGEASGLGLSTVFGFARQSGGHLAIESEPGAGTTVRLFLPRSGAEVRDRMPEPAEAAVPRGSGERILVVEDDEDVRRLLAGMLTSLDYAVLTAGDAMEALRFLEAGGAVDLVLTDVVLPAGVSGPDLAARIGVRTPGLPVVFMSGHPERDPGARVPEMEGLALLAKPFQRRTLAERITAALERRDPAPRQ